MTPRPSWLLRLVGSAIILAVLAWMIDWKAFARAIAAIDAVSLVLACCFMGASQASLAVRWATIVQGFSGRGFWRQMCLFWQAGLLNQVTPAALGGDFYRVAIMRLEETSLSFATGAVVFERALGFAGFATLYLALYAGCWRSLPPALSAYAASAAIAFGGVMVSAMMAGPLVRLFRRWIPKAALPFLAGVKAIVAIQDGARLATIGLTTLVANGAWIIAVAIVSRSLGFKISMALTGMITILTEFSRWFPFSVQGIGVREGVFVFSAQRLGENMGTALAVILVAYVLNSLIVLALGLLAMLLGERRKKSILEST